MGSTLFYINCSKILSDSPPIVMKMKTEINKLDLIDLKGFCKGKETINKVKRQPSEWLKTIGNKVADWDWSPKYINSSYSSKSEKNKHPNQKMSRRPK